MGPRVTLLRGAKYPAAQTCDAQAYSLLAFGLSDSSSMEYTRIPQQHS
jgi:hypothetical protein